MQSTGPGNGWSVRLGPHGSNLQAVASVVQWDHVCHVCCMSCHIRRTQTVTEVSGRNVGFDLETFLVGKSQDHSHLLHLLLQVSCHLVKQVGYAFDFRGVQTSYLRESLCHSMLPSPWHENSQQISTDWPTPCSLHFNDRLLGMLNT